jgi:hypothetical protein
MRKHEHYEVWLHDDMELSRMQGMGVAKREPLGSCPLSVVERVIFSDGTSRIYKAYRNLPIEAEFYRNIHSQHIPKAFYNYSSGEQHWLLLEDVKGQPPSSLSREQTLALACQAREIVNGIGLVAFSRHNLSKSSYSSFSASTLGCSIGSCKKESSDLLAGRLLPESGKRCRIQKFWLQRTASRPWSTET